MPTLEKSRSFGVTTKNGQIVQEAMKLFEDDWSRTETGKQDAKRAEKKEKKGAKEPARAEAAAS